MLIDNELVLSKRRHCHLSRGHYGRGVLAPLPFTPERALYNQWLSFIQMELDAHTLYVMRKHRDLADLYGEAPAAVKPSRDSTNK